MNPLFAQLALDWIEAERHANPDEWPVSGRPTKDEMSVAIDRVYQVISGEVKWSETSAGDKAVWKSRVQDVPMFLRSWRKDGTNRNPTPSDKEIDENDPYNQTTPRPVRPRRRPGMPPIPVGSRWRFYWNYFDTLERIDHNIDMSPPLLFQNKNIGIPFLTNLQIPGQTGSDSTFTILTISAAVSSLEALHWAADRVGMQFVRGNMPAVPFLFVRDLFRGVPMLRPVVIPVRQNFSARIEFKEKPPIGMEPWDLVIQLEGLQGTDVQ